jgi:hypothetical protein
MKKLCSVLLIYSMLLSACGNSSQPEQQTKEDTKQEQTKQEQTKQEETKSEEASTEAPTGDGIVSEEQVQKSYVYFDDILDLDVYEQTYEDIRDYFGVDGVFQKEEYNERMESTYRYYDWISEDDDTHFIHVNFRKKDGEDTYKVSAFNTSGFTADEAREKYLEQLQAEAE